MVVVLLRRLVLLMETKFGSRKSMPWKESTVDFSSESDWPTKPLSRKPAGRATGLMLNSVCSLMLRVMSSATSRMPFFQAPCALSG